MNQNKNLHEMMDNLLEHNLKAGHGVAWPIANDV